MHWFFKEIKPSRLFLLNSRRIVRGETLIIVSSLISLDNFIDPILGLILILSLKNFILLLSSNFGLSLPFLRRTVFFVKFRYQS
ncbi:hypothetical protein A0H76_2274 [Hepatospora eriocheir]|uniref:Uncharacterized protein n=1 Tax=Hepatospora eriocheir TaxID=1081669 RepID=A0A1X0QFK3_9MICR|nr:hypothetical protein A0H76_2274 [Hepatospora eriocheir]